MLVLRVTFSLNIPILNGPDDVRLVGRAKLDLDFVTAIGFGLLQEQIEPADAPLEPFLILQHHGRVIAIAGWPGCQAGVISRYRKREFAGGCANRSPFGRQPTSTGRA